MNRPWFYILGVMILGTMLKYVIVHPLAWVGIELGVLGIAYLILRRYPYLDMRGSMMFLGGLTVINILVDLGIMSGMMGNLALLALLGWTMFGGGTRR